MDPKSNFVQAVLGEAGSAALQKAALRSVRLENAILPRAILAWLSIAPNMSYEGEIPGLPESFVSFAKSEERFSGRIRLDGQDCAFQRATVDHLAACVAVALGADHERVDAGLRDSDAAGLGKSIDLLAKAQAVFDLTKSETLYCTACKDPLDEHGHCKVRSHWPILDLAKGTELPGQTAKPRAPVPPAPGTREQPQDGPPVPKPAAATAGAPKLPTAPRSLLPAPKKAPGFRITKSQAAQVCPACGKGQFAGDRFTGCWCFSALAKSVRVTPSPMGYALEFSGDWDKDGIVTLQESFGSK